MGLTVRIDSELRIVIPIREDAEGRPVAWAYHVPISLAVFDANYRTLAATKARLFGQGLRYAFEAGPLVASRHLLDEGRRDAAENGSAGPDGAATDGGTGALLAEMRRLTTVILPSPAGWDPVPVDVAMQRHELDPEDWREAESRLVFFSCMFWLTPRQKRQRIASEVVSVIEGSITSLGITEWIASLPSATSSGGSTAAA